MPFDPNAIANSPTVALVVVLVILGLFIIGVIVPGKYVEALLVRIDRMAAAQERENEIEQAKLDWERSHPGDRRGAPGNG